MESDKQKFCGQVQRGNMGVYCTYVGAYILPPWCLNSCKDNGKSSFIGSPRTTMKQFHHRSSSGCHGEKIIRTFLKNNEESNNSRFARNFLVAADLAKDSERAVVNEVIFIERRQKCAICPPEDKQGCSCDGCRQWNKLIFFETKCYLDKWS
jgi:hypothetical protein